MCSIVLPYMAEEAIQGKMPSQLSLHVNQVVQVVPIFICNNFSPVTSHMVHCTTGVSGLVVGSN